MSVLTGVPVRTLQVWRREGFFVPALPAELTGYAPGELYDLGDAVTVKVMRMLLEADVDREVIARLGEEMPTWDDHGQFFSFRDFAAAEPAWWYMIPAAADLLDTHELIRVWFDDELAEQASRDDAIECDCELMWLGKERLAVWFPLSPIAAEIAAQADSWRRQRRIPVKDWPPWM